MAYAVWPMPAGVVPCYCDAVHRFLLLHGGNPLDELLIAAAGAIFLIGGWIVIRMAPAPDVSESRPADEADTSPSDEQEVWRPQPFGPGQRSGLDR